MTDNMHLYDLITQNIEFLTVNLNETMLKLPNIGLNISFNGYNPHLSCILELVHSGVLHIFPASRFCGLH